MTLLWGLPVLAFGGPAVLGYPLVRDDNLVQSYPLRLLVGQQIRHGHLPLWDPWIWSGTPLLAGFNAGAAFPATWLFAVLPAPLAFAAGQALALGLAGSGLYCLLRLHQVSRSASTLAGATFAFTGFMSSQLVHLDLVQGASLIPWALVAVNRYACRRRTDRGWRWIAMLGGVLGLVVLAGAPEPVVDAALAVALYGASAAWGQPGRRLGILAAGIVAAGIAVALSAAQWVPGLAFAGTSQRAAADFTFFSAGSFPPRLGVLALVPYLLGGYDRLGVPNFFGSYSLAEIQLYAGILPAIAALTMLVPLFRRRPWSRQWRIWYVVGAVGAVTAFGSYTPLSHLLFHVPLLANQRLPSRGLVLVDLAMCALFGFWLDRLVRRGRSPGWSHPLGRALTLAPLAGVIVIYVTFLAWGPRLVRGLGAPLWDRVHLHPMITYLTLSLGVTLLATVVLVGLAHLRADRRMAALAMVMVADIGLFTLYQSWIAPAAPTLVHADSPAAASLAAATGPTGRFAVYNPSLFSYTDLVALGSPDLNIVSSLPSVQGYGSLVSGAYQQATGAHDQASVYPEELAGTTFDDLDLALLAALPQYLYTPLAPAQPPPPPAAQSVTSTGAGSRPPPPIRLAPLQPGQRRSWYLGGDTLITAVTLPAAPSAAALRLGVMTAAGTVSWPDAVRGRDAEGDSTFNLGGPRRAVAVMAENTSGRPLETGPPIVSTWDQGDLRLDGPLQDALKPPHWVYTATLDPGGYALFRNTRARGWAWVDDGSGTPMTGARARVTSRDGAGATTVEVDSPRPGILVRSETDAPGWTAVVSGDGPSHTEAVTSHNLVQAVPVPAGRHRVVFSYGPPRLYPALTVSALTAAGLLAVAAWAVADRRRKTREEVA